MHQHLQATRDSLREQMKSKLDAAIRTIKTSRGDYERGADPYEVVSGSMQTWSLG